MYNVLDIGQAIEILNDYFHKIKLQYLNLKK